MFTLPGAYGTAGASHAEEEAGNNHHCSTADVRDDQPVQPNAGYSRGKDNAGIKREDNSRGCLNQ